MKLITWVLLVVLQEIAKCEADFAVGRPVSNRMSSGTIGGYGYKAIDGVETTCSWTLFEIEPWYMVWLKRRYEVTRLVINISDAKQGEELESIYVYLGDTPDTRLLCVNYVGPAIAEGTLELSCEKPTIGQFVRIVKQKDPVLVQSVLSMCEVEVNALKLNASQNVAFQRPAFHSSTQMDMYAHKAVDGNYNTSDNACTLTEAEDAPWWLVELEDVYLVENVVIQTGAKVFANIDVQVGLTTSTLKLCAHFKGPAILEGSVTIDCVTPIEGTYVKIVTKKDSIISPSALKLCEMNIFGNNVSEANLAIGKIPSISETRYRVPESNESVDGDYLTCQITYPRGNHAWWMVELEKRYQIQRIALLISLGYNQINTNISTYVGDWQKTPFKCNNYTLTFRRRFEQRFGHNFLSLPCSTPAPEGKQVKITTDTTNLDEFMVFNLCELEVYGRSLEVPDVTWECGGLLESAIGFVTSRDRNGDGMYDNDEECTWIIHAPEFFVIEFTITSMNIEPDPLCSYDYLKLYERGDYEDAVIGIYCGTTPPPTITTTSNVLVVKFITDLGIVHEGFNASYTRLYGFDCGFLHDSPEGQFPISVDSADRTHQMVNESITCTWLIKADYYETIELVILEAGASLEDHSKHHILKVYDGYLTESTLLGVYYTSDTPINLLSTTPLLFIQLHSPNASSPINFQANYRFHCGKLQLSESGYLGSVDRDNNGLYDTDINCTWLMEVEPYEFIELTFTSFDIQEPLDGTCDTLQIFDGAGTQSKLVASYCGTSPPPMISSTTSTLTVNLLSRINNSGAGFTAKYTVKCGGYFPSESGIIHSVDADNDGLYEHYQDCIWTIIAGKYQTVVLKIIELDLPQPDSTHYPLSSNCPAARLMISEERNDFVFTHCGTTPPPMIRSNSNILQLRFISTHEAVGRGFKASYSTLNGYCGGDIDWPYFNGVFRSVDIDKDGFYEPYQDCTWFIEGYIDIKQLNITDIDIQPDPSCTYDFLRVTTISDMASTVVGIYCGTTPPPPILVATDVLSIQFYSDGSIEGKGFNATYAMLQELEDDCGGTLTAEVGVFDAPSADEIGMHGRIHHCVWRIMGYFRDRIQLNISNVDIPDYYSDKGFECRESYVQIYENERDYGVYCENSIVPMITSASNILFVEYKTDTFHVDPGSGFNAEYNIAEGLCGGTIVEPSGWLDLTDINYSLTSRHYFDCWWTILSYKSKQILFNLIELNFNNDRDCKSSFLKIFDDTISEAGHMATFCDSNNTAMIISTKHYLHVHLRLNKDFITQQFNASFVTTELYRGSGELLKHMVGIIQPKLVSSDGVFYNYENFVDSLWTIIGKETSSILLKVMMMDIEFHHDCSYDALNVFDGYKEEGKLLGSFCGRSSQPTSLSSTGHIMAIHFVTDASGTDKGFKLAYFQVNCGVIINDTEGYISALDEDDDGMYDGSQYCIWKLPIDQYTSIHLNIYNFSVQQQNQSCLLDHLEVIWNDTEHSNYCAAIEHKKTVFVTQLEIHFYADLITNNNNFLIAYTKDGGSVQQCGGEIHEERGWLAPMDANLDGLYDHSQNCSWLIIARYHPTIRLHVLHMDIECGYDYLQIDSETFCGTTPPPIATPPSNMLRVSFYADASISGAGFNATYYVAGGACGGILQGNVGWFSPVNVIDELYDNNLDCQWFVQVDSSLRVHLTFQYLHIQDSEACQLDFVQIYDIRYCGSTLPPVIVSDTNSMYVIFFTDDRITGRGFNATYLAVEDPNTNCKTELSEIVGYIRPPDSNNDGLYDYNLNCWWTLMAGEFQAINLNVQNIDIDGLIDLCVADRLEIYLGSDTTKVLIGTYCGELPTFVINSTANRMAIHFVSDQMINSVGFTIRYTYIYVTHKDCGVALYDIHGWFTTRDLDNDTLYDTYLDCLWIILPRDNLTTILRVTEIDIEQSASCYFDYLKIYNGSMSEEALVGKYCGTIEPLVVVTNLVLFVEFISDGSVNGHGFNATYFHVSDEMQFTTNEPNMTETSERQETTTVRSSTRTSDITTTTSTAISEITSDAQFLTSPLTRNGTVGIVTTTNLVEETTNNSKTTSQTVTSPTVLRTYQTKLVAKNTSSSLSANTAANTVERSTETTASTGQNTGVVVQQSYRSLTILCLIVCYLDMLF